MAKKYIPNEKEKYMCAKQKAYFKKKLLDWKNDIIETNNKGLYNKEVDQEIYALSQYGGIYNYYIHAYQ